MSEIISEIKNLDLVKENLRTESCTLNKPFITLGDKPSPTLDYDLPQSTTFSTYGTICVLDDSSVFKEDASLLSNDDYFSKSSDALVKLFNASVQLGCDDFGLKFNSNILRNTIDKSKTDFSRISVESFVEKDEVTSEPRLMLSDTCFNEQQLKNLKELGYRPVIVGKLNGFGTRIRLLQNTGVIHPRLFVIEEYKTTSYLGNYGAGKTLGTFSLLPGERTTIAIKTYKNSASVKNCSENLLDSFSQSSVDEMENIIENEIALTSSSQTALGTSISASISFMTMQCSADAKLDTSSSRSANTRALNRALGKHCEQTNSVRNVEINTTSTETIEEGEEFVTTREIENVNKSRVLNFVFRQLLQEYVSITYLSNIRIAYCNGCLESVRVVDVEEIDSLLNDVVKSDLVEQVKEQILSRYRVVRNYKSQPIRFLKEVTIDAKTYGYDESYCVCESEGEDYEIISGREPIHVDGVILNVQRNVLRTDSVVADALIGHGEALDCFNQRVQDAIAVSEHLKNLETVQKINLISSIEDPGLKVELCKSNFCSCPQENDNVSIK